MARIPRSQLVAIALGLGFGGLGLLASTGITPRLETPLLLVLFAYVLLALAGYVAGRLTIERRAVLDRVRWETVESEGLTSGERQLAHREADRQIRLAGVTYFAAAVAPGAWLSYQLRDPNAFAPSDLLILAPVIGFVIGMILTNRRLPSRYGGAA